MWRAIIDSLSSKGQRQKNKQREQQFLLQEMSRLAQVGGWEIDLVENTFSWTVEMARLHEFDADQTLTPAMLLEHYKGEDRRRLEQALAHTLETGAPADMDVLMQLPSGTRRMMRAHWRATVDAGKVTRIWAMAQDLTARHRLEESMRMADLIYRTTSDAIVVTNDDGVIVDANPTFIRLMGYSLEALIGMDPRQLRIDPDGYPNHALVRQTLKDSGRWEGEIRLRRQDGEPLDTYVEIDVMHDSANGWLRRVLHVTDLSEQRRKDAEIWKHANFDGLTGLPNRGLFLDRLQSAIDHAHSIQGKAGLLCLDLDRFTMVNEMAGQEEGDAILVRVVTRLRSCLPQGSTLARLGGDRFAIALGSADPDIELIAKTIVDVIDAPFESSAGAVHTSASVGIAVHPDDSDSVKGLMSSAEQAMAAAKRAGGNRFQYAAPSLQREALTKLGLRNDLRHALARNELQMYYQPIVDVASGRIRKAEALIRWLHPAHGLVSPANFIPLAEESGLIVEIGEWVMNEAITSLLRWHSSIGIDIELSVNQSPMQFEHNSVAHWIERFLKAGLPRHCITLEITESMLVNDASRMRNSIRMLKESGAKVSLDDFGTGFSALSYLKLFEVDYLKIDKSFIQHIEDDGNDKALTQAIIDLAHKLKIETIAEGVETAAQRDILTSFGCDYLQGYFYARPLSLSDFEALLLRQRACRTND